MKYVLLFHGCLLLVIAYGCQLREAHDAIREAIPGTYIRFSAHEYGTEYDTLVITLQNASASEYRILRRWKFERVLDGHAIKPEYKRMTTSARYDPTKKILLETGAGDSYSFDVDQKILFNGPVKYHKL